MGVFERSVEDRGSRAQGESNTYACRDVLHCILQGIGVRHIHAAAPKHALVVPASVGIMAILDARAIATSVAEGMGLALVHRRRHTLPLIIESHRQAVSPTVTHAAAIHHRQFKPAFQHRDGILRLRLNSGKRGAAHLLLVLKDTAQHEGVVAEGMEELRTIAQTDTAHAELRLLRTAFQRRLRKGQRARVGRRAEHIIDICTQRHPVAYIETQAAIYLTNSARAHIRRRVVVVRVNRVAYRQIVTY